MLGILDEYERSLALSEAALGQIKSQHLTAIPRNYEVWYVYAAGSNPAVRRVVTETLQRNGKLTESDLQQIYEAHLSTSHTTDRIDEVGARVIKEVDGAMALIGDALGMTSNFDRRLAGARHSLSEAGDRGAILAVVDMLVAATRDMQASNEKLRSRLVATKAEICNLQQDLREIHAATLTDPLTGLGNRKFFDRTIAEAVAQATASGEPLSLLMCDIDHFKSFNDNYGHVTGDQVLRLMALAIKQNVKGQDITVRYGGEEFAVVLPATTLRAALTVADHIRRAVMSKELKKKSTGEILGRVTISVGVSTLHPGDDVNSLIERADDCLYAAKRTGRNRVVSESDPDYSADYQASMA